MLSHRLKKFRAQNRRGWAAALVLTLSPTSGWALSVDDNKIAVADEGKASLPIGGSSIQAERWSGLNARQLGQLAATVAIGNNVREETARTIEQIAEAAPLINDRQSADVDTASLEALAHYLVRTYGLNSNNLAQNLQGTSARASDDLLAFSKILRTDELAETLRLIGNVYMDSGRTERGIGRYDRAADIYVGAGGVFKREGVEGLYFEDIDVLINLSIDYDRAGMSKQSLRVLQPVFAFKDNFRALLDEL